MNCKIPWYMDDPRFEPGTVADVGNVRIYLRKTDRKSNNKWRIYIAVRTRKGHGVPDSLKREVAVAQFSDAFTLEEAQHLAEAYLADFLGPILADCNPNMKEVTRCKDCKFYGPFYKYTTGEQEDYGGCRNTNSLSGQIRLRGERDYCSLAERKVESNG